MTERRCEFTDLIAYSCAHCRGHDATADPISDYDDLPKELDADGFSEALWAAASRSTAGV